MKILVAPLNWGLGHATRCIPLIHQYMRQGDEVVLGGDGESLLLLRRRFPHLRVVDLPSLELSYDADPKQRAFYWRAIPALIRFTIADHYYLSQLLAREHFDRVISDNRFGLFSRDVHTVYITHQLYPILPKRLRLWQPLVRALHACIYRRYTQVWVPDEEALEQSLSGALSHGGGWDKRVKYIGALSRFAMGTGDALPEGGGSEGAYRTVAILSGLEPQRSILEREILARYADSEDSVLVVRGKIREASMRMQQGNITIVPHISDEQMAQLLQQAQTIIARSGYSTIMDLKALGVLAKAELHPTPGQSEQEYLAEWINFRTFAP